MEQIVGPALLAGGEMFSSTIVWPVRLTMTKSRLAELSGSSRPADAVALGLAAAGGWAASAESGGEEEGLHALRLPSRAAPA